MSESQVLIVNLGSQYTLIIERTLRELGVRSVVLSPAQSATWLAHNNPKSIILSGGDMSVTDEKAPQPPAEIFTTGVPVLGICFGMQYIAHTHGGTLHNELTEKEYGKAEVNIDPSDVLFDGLEKNQTVWASHGDTVSTIPDGFTQIATSSNGGVAGISNPEKQLWGIQFHPEVIDTPNGKDMLSNFIFSICQAEKDWKPENMIESIRKEIQDVAGDEKVIGGFSGGVDSTAAFAIIAPVLKENLLAICIDGGQLREGELEEIKKHADAAGATLKVIDAKDDFQKVFGTEIDAEKKRARFRELYKKILEDEALAFGATTILQGSLATDYIESGEHGGALIKTHHNIGLDFSIKNELHPLRQLFKYEVRALAAEIGLPDSVVHRQPSPGPGLFIRIIGQPPTTDMLDIVRWADHQTTEIIKKHGLYDSISQLVVALLGFKAVGVKGDARAYGYTIGVRGINTTDFMTATGTQLPDDVRREITETITKHPDIVHVGYFETNKPPATTEFE